MKKKIIITLCLLAFLNSFANKYDKDSIKKIDIPVMENVQYTKALIIFSVLDSL